MRRFPGGGIELDEFDAAPEGTEGQPQLAVGVLRDRRVNGVEIIAAAGLNDDTTVGPGMVWIGGVERGVRREADGGSVLAEGRNGIVEEVSVREKDDIRRPEITAVAGHGVGGPGGCVDEDTRAIGPVHQVF